MSRNEGLGVGAIVFITLAVIATLSIGIWFVRVQLAPEIGAGNAEIQLENANSRIVRYEEFYGVCASVQNAEAAINSESHRLSTTTDENQKRIIEANLAALHVTRSQAINQYNSLAAQYYTSGRFQGQNLPERLSTEPFIPNETELTVCEVN